MSLQGRVSTSVLCVDNNIAFVSCHYCMCTDALVCKGDFCISLAILSSPFMYFVHKKKVCTEPQQGRLLYTVLRSSLYT